MILSSLKLGDESNRFWLLILVHIFLIFRLQTVEVCTLMLTYFAHIWHFARTLVSTDICLS